jgi:hypothetical protein
MSLTVTLQLLIKSKEEFSMSFNSDAEDDGSTACGYMSNTNSVILL